MNKRIDYLDLLKTIGIIMVVGTHVPIFEYDFINGDSFIQYILKLLSEGVVIFICVNGYLLLSKKDLDIKKHYLKTIRIFVLTCIWALILIFAGVIFDRSPITRSLIVNLFLDIGSGLYVKELWFLLDLIGIYLIYPLIWLAYK